MSLISFLNPDAIADNSIGLEKIKTEGKVLSDNNYTTEEKTKLAGIATGANNYALPVATSGALGGVKSGTDITVDSNGNVSVNDDSHNHIIGNVDGLQTALDGKAALSHVHVIGQVTDLQSNLDAKANAADVYTKSEVDGITSRNKGLITELATAGNGYNVKLDWSPDTAKENTIDPAYRGQVNLGAGCTTSMAFAYAEGSGNIASGNVSHAEGLKNTVSGKTSHVEGQQNTASGNVSHAEGVLNTVTSDISHAEGRNNIVSGLNSHAECYNNIVSGNNSHVEGSSNITSGHGSHAEGFRTVASGGASHTQGRYTVASGDDSSSIIGSLVIELELTGDANATSYICNNISEVICDNPEYLSYLIGPDNYGYIAGVANIDTARRPIKIKSVDTSTGIIEVESTLSTDTALGNTKCIVSSTIAHGNYSFAARGVSAGGSSWTVNRGGFAKGDNSFVGGNCNSAYNDSEVAFGHFNKSVGSSDSALAPIATIGIGADKDHRKNATEIMQNGDAYLIGIGGYDGTNAGSATSIQDALATKEYVENTFASAIATADAMIYKGTIGTGGTVTSLPSTTAKTGWTYKVITAGSYAGQTCEVGDMIVCLTDGSASVAATWTVIQTNIDGAVIGPSSATDGQIALFNGTSGKAIKAVNASTLTVGTANKTANSLSLKVGSTTKTFDGSSAVSATLSSNSITIPVPKVYETTTSTNTTSIPASTHGCGDKPIVQCYEDGAVVVCAIVIDDSGNITVDFNGTHTVKVRVIGMGTQTLSDFIKLT